MKNEEIKAMESDDIKGKMIEFSTLLTKLKFAHSGSPIENPQRIKFIRRDIARFKTELQKREIENLQND